MKTIISQKVSTFVVNHPKRSLICSIFLALIFLPGISLIVDNFTVRAWLSKTDSKVVALDEFERSYGNDETINILVDSQTNIFNNNTLDTIHKITEQLWKTSDIIRVESITNYNWVESIADDILIEPLIDSEKKYTQSELDQISAKVGKDKDLPQFLISKNQKFTMIVGHIKPTFGARPRYGKIINEVEQFVSTLALPTGMVIKYSGASVIFEGYKDVSDKDLRLVLPFLVTVFFVLLFIFFKSLVGVLLPFSVIILTTIVAFGVEGYLGIEFSNLIAVVPAVLLAIGLADSLHIMISYRHFILEGLSKKESAIKSLIKNFYPTLLTSITTSVGFFGLMLSDIVPLKGLGIICGLGCLIAWFFTYFFLGPLLRFLNLRSNTKKKNWTGELLFRFVDKFKIYINIFVTILFGITVYFTFQNEVNSDPISHFSKGHYVKDSYELFERRLGYGRMIAFDIDSGEVDGIKDPRFLKKVDAFNNWLLQKGDVIKSRSVLDIIKKMNKTLNENTEVNFKIPDSKRAVADILFMYSVSLPAGMDLNNMMTIDNKKIRMMVFWKISETRVWIEESRKIVKKAKELGLDLYEAGQSPIYSVVNNKVVDTFVSSVMVTFIFISLMMYMMFRNVKLALMSLLPNIIPLSIGMAAIYYFGLWLDIGTAMICSVCLGICVDDTIHFVANYNQYRNEGFSEKESILKTYGHTGVALAATTLLLVLGFGSFYLGDFVPNQNFGAFCALILTAALIIDLIYLPALLLVFDKRKSPSP